MLLEHRFGAGHGLVSERKGDCVVVGAVPREDGAPTASGQGSDDICQPCRASDDLKHTRSSNTRV